MEYLLILVGLFALSLFLEFKFHLRLYSSRKERFIIPLLFFLIGTLWDSYAVIRGHWYFNFDNLLGVRIGVLPLEEYLFFIVVPYAVLTLYKVLKKEI